MKPHPRIRKTIKWGGAWVTVLLIGVWIASARSYCFAPCPFGGSFGFQAGGFIRETRFGTLTATNAGWFRDGKVFFIWRPMWTRYPSGLDLFVSGWMLAAPMLALTASAWRLDTLARRRERAVRLGLCPKCNYDRAGLAEDAVCPECGSKGGPA